jgi:hypothetical protein
MILTAACFGVLSAMSFLGIRETSDSYLSSSAMPGWSFVLIAALLAVRAARVAVIVEGEHILLRSLVRNRRVALAEILKIDSVGYSGFLNWSGRSGIFKMLQVQLKGRSIEFPAMAGTPKSIDRLGIAIDLAVHNALERRQSQ